MNSRFVGCLALVAISFAAATAMGQGVQTDIKWTPDFDSDTTVIPVAVHHAEPGSTPGTPYPSPPEIPGAGWAGSMVAIHVLDNTEIDIDAIVPLPGMLFRLPFGTPGGALPGIYTGPIPEPFGPRSSNAQSVPLMITVLHPLAQQSGITLLNSINQPLFDMVIHGKNTDTGENSDVDVSVKFWDIWHTRPGPGSQIIHFPNSVSIWAQSFLDDPPGPNGTTPWEQFHIASEVGPGVPGQFNSMYQIPEGPPIDDPQGHWVHIPDSLTFHTVDGPGSNFFKYFLNTATLGVDHGVIPEPASLMLFGMGLVCAVMGIRSRRRRR